MKIKANKQNNCYGRSLPQSEIDLLANAMQYDKPVNGLTHNFYRYPARFSPQFAAAAIEIFTKQGDLVLDPFMGGGTTIVEARSRGRLSIGTDINELALFVCRAKTTIITTSDAIDILNWGSNIEDIFKLNQLSGLISVENNDYYLRHLSCKDTWRIRKMLDIGLEALPRLKNNRQKLLIQCALLATGQWALDCRITIPTATEFRQQLHKKLIHIVESAVEYSRLVRKQDRIIKCTLPRRSLCIKQSATNIHKNKMILKYPKPRLILTSPPYPGVHVLYHRWQIQGRRETPAPYWISQSEDGTGGSYYTFGDRKQIGLSDYFKIAAKSFNSIRQLCSKNTIIVQLVAFPDIDWQLPNYLKMMEEAGFKQYKSTASSDTNRHIITREVPNRKWYAAQKGNTPSSKELLLIHYPR